MAVTTENLAEYLRLPPGDTEGLTAYLDAARSKARSAGVPDYQRNAQYDLFLLSLAAFYYEARGLSTPGQYQSSAEEENARKLTNSFVLALRHAGEDPEPEPEPGAGGVVEP